VTPDGAFLLLLTSEGAVFVFDIAEGSPTQNQVVGQISTGSSVKSVTVTPDGGLLYLIMESNDAIYVYRLDVDTSAGVRGSVPDEAQTRVRATMVTTLFAGEDPSAMAFAANGSGIAVVTNAGDQTVSIFDPSNRPIAVMVSGLGARQVDRGALITWMTTAEPGVAGYHVLRADGLDAGYRRITEAPVAARGVGASYSFVDESVRPARTYFYKLEVVLQREASKEFGPVEFTYLAQFALRQNAPNPFNPATRIAFTIPEACRVQLFIYDAAGRQIKALVDRRLQADHYEVLWDGTNNRGTRVASGVYFYRLEAGRHAATRKMVLLR
jgi:DNA-binding beta-propeller fold protein YncE